MKTENKTIVHFHIGKGGYFHNPGFKTYCGTNKIESVLNSRDDSGRWVFLNYENQASILKTLQQRNLTNLIDLYGKCEEKKDFTELEKRTGLDFGELAYCDINSNVIIYKHEAETGIGRLRWDGDYDTDICDFLKDCDKKELLLIAEKDTDLIEEYFNDCTELDIKWESFNGDYSNLIDDYFESDSFDITDFYTEVEEEA